MKRERERGGGERERGREREGERERENREAKLNQMRLHSLHHDLTFSSPVQPPTTLC